MTIAAVKSLGRIEFGTQAENCVGRDIKKWSKKIKTDFR
jgi:hypothetical protein